MPFVMHRSSRIRYELEGPGAAPAFVLVNGLTQYAELWAACRAGLTQNGFRVATFDLLGQGESDKPALFINQADQVEALGRVIDERTGLALGGTSYLQDLLLPMNLSDAWLMPLLDRLVSVKRQGWLVNALQNLMESFLDFEPLTPLLPAIQIPTMILNGEFDFLTPRSVHETLRVHIPNSSPVIIPRAYHAFTLEKASLTADLLTRFARDVMAGRWQGNKAVMVAPEQPDGPLTPFPEGYDHLRAIPVRLPP